MKRKRGKHCQLKMKKKRETHCQYQSHKSKMWKTKPPKWNTVPWFSWEEWQEVYRNIYGNKLEDWRKAYHQISVWKSRVNKLAAGIEGTIPLLHAQIAQADPSIDESFKNSILNIAIIRFVSIVTKGFENQYMDVHTKPAQGMHSVMNLPPFLVGLRNILVHRDEIMGSSETLLSALDASLQWIKLYYWEDEDAKIMEKEMSKLKKEQNSIEKESLIKTDKCSDPCEVPSQHFETLKNAIQVFLDQFLYCVKRPIARRRIFMQKELLFNEIKTHIGSTRQGSMKMLVSDFFYAPQIQSLQKLVNEDEEKCHRCDRSCFLNEHHFKYATVLLNMICEFHCIDVFLMELVKQGKHHPVLCAEWIRALLNTVVTSDGNKTCMQHRFLITQISLQQRIRWRTLVYNLLHLAQPWSSSLAFEILDHGVVEMDSESKVVLKGLLDLYTGSKFNPDMSLENGQIEVASTDGQNEVATLEHVIQEARKTSKKCLRAKTVYSSLRKKDVIKMETYLGVLPHQVDDPYFFQQLILYPSEPRKKKRKRTHTVPEGSLL